ncbi:hypothetical protein ABI59_04300 [Acidobacteria bacterium Mor1]|nr:hypothetical protein ABI59_04300 [Acidobacteria bacterium Mor1]
MSAGAAGVSLPELVFGLGLIGLLCTMALPSIESLAHQGRAAAGVRHLGAELEAVRWMALAGGRSHGLLFERSEGGWGWQRVVDGNGNGIRRAEIRSGVDRRLGGVRRLSREVPGARLGFPGPGPYPRVPPSRGSLGNPDDPVRFGGSDLVSFSPRGSGTSGSLYVTSERGALYALVLHGRTARQRVRRYAEGSGRWMP